MNEWIIVGGVVVAVVLVAGGIPLILRIARWRAKA